jgi:hypothetical protein
MTSLRQSALAALFLLAFAEGAVAQQPVLTLPGPATTAGGNASTTIASTNVWQQVFAGTSSAPASAKRHGCTVINQGSNTMWVTEGLATSASTKPLAVVLAANQAYYCSVGEVVLTGQINVTGTAGDTFYAAQY